MGRVPTAPPPPPRRPLHFQVVEGGGMVVIGDDGAVFVMGVTHLAEMAGWPADGWTEWKPVPGTARAREIERLTRAREESSG